MPIIPKLFALALALAAALSTAPALAATHQCSDSAIVDYVNNGFKTNGTWGDGQRANSKGGLRIFGTPRTLRATKSLLICRILVRHTDPLNGATEDLAVRLTVDLRSDGSVSNANMTFLESSQ